MHTFQKHNYPNLLQQINISSRDIQTVVAKYKLEFSKEKNQEVEWGIKLPIFVDAFYNFITDNQRIPSQQEFFQHYLFYNHLFFSNLNRPELETGIKARVYRTYPSLIRDLHFNKYILEKLGNKCDVIYNIRLDVEEGIDLMIVTKKGNYGICFFTKTRRAYIGRKAKEYRHTLFHNVSYVEMPLDLKGSIKAGDFFLYGEHEYRNLYTTLSK